MKKYLILKSDKDAFERYYINHMQSENAETHSLYKFNKGIMWKILVMWIQKLHIPFQQIWFSDWVKIYKKFDVVIIFDRCLNWNIVKYIKKNAPNIRIIVWYWNLVNKDNMIPDKFLKYVELWTFDKGDMLKYNMRANVQFFPGSVLKTQEEAKKRDAFFIGREKGRREQVLKIKNMLEEAGLIVDVNFASEKRTSHKKEKIKPLLDYTEILKMISESKCIIDVLQHGQKGMTLRTLEALFFSKKLITTDISIKNEEFYNPANILVWDNPSVEEVKAFFAMPYEPIEQEIINKYTFIQWLENFE